MTQPEHKSIEGLKNKLFNFIVKVTLDFDDGVFNADKEVDELYAIIEPHLNIRNLLERFAEFLTAKDKEAMDLVVPKSVQGFMNISYSTDYKKLLDEFIEKELGK